jgi:lytic murein transglycosylase
MEVIVWWYGVTRGSENMRGRFQSFSPASAALLAVMLSLQPGCAQVGGRVDPATTQSVTPFAAPSGGNREWSGESGASGHPQMTADAIRAAAANFNQCLAGLSAEAARRGVPRASFDNFTRGMTPDLSIMDRVDAQPEFTKAFWEYLDVLVSEDRIQRGRELLAQHRAAFDSAERAYGVDRHVIAAIWGIESKYSTMIGDRPVIRSTATLACIGRRQDYFRSEFLAIIELLHRGDVSAEDARGSWAGAFGPTQFMPTVYRSYAVDADGDGRRDVIRSMPDLLASTSNYFRRHGWESGQTWGYEVELPKNFNFMLADRSRQMTLHEWERLGIRRPGGKPFPRAGRLAGAGLPDAEQFPRHHALQPVRGLCAGDRSSLRPAARRRAVRAGLATARARADARRAHGNAAAALPPRLRYRGGGRAIRAEDPRRDPRFSGPRRAGAGRLRLAKRAGPPARFLSSYRSCSLKAAIFGRLCARAWLV